MTPAAGRRSVAPLQCGHDAPSIYLASASPRRRELLEQIGIPHAVLLAPAPEGEDEPRLPGESPASYVLRTAREKCARGVQWMRSQAMPERPVLAADTTVILGQDILGKPQDADQATAMLRRLSGGVHEVRTAVVVCWDGESAEAVNTTRVWMAELDDVQIARYVASGEPFGKAGGYGIQGLAGSFVSRLEGSYTGVMGLPLYETAQLLGLAGIVRP